MLSWLQKSYTLYKRVTGIKCCSQLHDRELVPENCKSAFDLLFSKCKSKVLNGHRSFYEPSLTHLLKKFLLENIILQC